MNEKEVREIRRRFRADKNSIDSVCACYVNEGKKIIAMFEEPLAGRPQEESAQYLNLLKKALSGSLGKNLVSLSFSNEQVVSGEDLKNSALKDDELLGRFFQRIIDTLNIEGSFLILLAHDAYSVPYRSKDGMTQMDASDSEYDYVLCAVCPVKLTQPELSYYSAENRFHAGSSSFVAGAPVLGFLFPAFDDRCTNLYDVLYYTKSASENHQEFIDAMFRTTPPMPADEQKETFQSVLCEALGEECSYEVVQTVHERVGEWIEQHKQNHEPEPLTLGTREIEAVLQDCGVSKERVTEFSERFTEEFGEDAALPPANVIDRKRFEIRTPDVSIKVTPERSDLIEMRVINGSKYILISADEPTGNIDPELSFEIVDLLNEINKLGVTVVMVTHEHDLVAQFNRRVITIEHGAICA